MKKLLLGLAALGLAAGVSAQRLALYEEFSGENCGPCAASNPGLWTLLSGGTNLSKVMLIKYQSPIPSAGPIYNLYKTFTDARLTYYSVPFAPYGRLNGTNLGTGTAAPSSPGHIANLTQTDINNESSGTPAINLTVSHSWNATGDSVTATVVISSPTAYAPTGANLKLRIALVEHLSYATPPGTNGETEFHNVVREMYPNAAGTQLANAWTTGQTQTLTIKGRVPSYVNKADANTIFVAWIQNDADKSIPQAAKSNYVPIPLDVASSSISVPSTLTCAAGTTTIVPTVTLKNTGTSTLTSAKIYYKLDATGTWQNMTWTGSLAATATTTVVLPALTATGGNHVVYDSVAAPNGSVDINSGNNISYKLVNVYNTTGGALPMSTGFENAGNLPANWILYDANSNSQNWLLVKGSTTNIGHGGSTYLLYHNNYNFAAGEVNYAVLPSATLPTGTKSLNFYVAYAQYQTENDALDVVYSTNCGTSWTSIWTKSGSALATAPATTASFVPTQTQWQGYSIDVTSIPAGAMIAFKASSQFGNNLFIDDVLLRSGPTGVAQIISDNSTTLAPNPAVGSTTLTFNLTKSSTINVQVLDAVGRVVASPVNETMQAGTQKVNINTQALAAGIYNVVIKTEEGTHTERLSVAH
jgi:hypothetical protein